MPAGLDAALLDEAALESELENGETPPLELFRHHLQHASQVLVERFHAGRAATELVPARSQVVDTLLRHAWQLFLPSDSNEIALVAVGGYGRGELHPASDIDLLLLLKGKDDPYRAGIEAFLTFLWDIGLEVGHSVRSVQQCADEAARDITVATNLQESRLLVGEAELLEQQRIRCSADKIWPGPAYFKAKLAEQEQRHLKYHETAYNLEPNIKESPGGLRDLQMIGWVAKRHYDVDTLHALVAQQFITEDEYRLLHESQAFLWQVRFGLHVISNRREDRLLFDYQRTLAKQFGYRDKPGKLAVEQFMKQYYRTVMELSRLNEMLLQLFQEEILYASDPSEPVIINNRFQARKGFLEARNEAIFNRYPFALLEVFLILEQHPKLKGVRANTIRQMREQRDLIDASFRDDLRCRSLFMEIMRQTTGITHELRRMNRYGILAAYLPAFSRIVGQMQHDLFHVYTVDEHTLMVIRNLRRFTVAEFESEFPLCSKLIHQIPKQELLLISGLFHDIAKGRGGDHAALGAVDAKLFCQQHGLSNYDTQLVAWLVANHLLMSATAQRKDISDPQVVHAFALQVGDTIRLKYLYLLTVSDIRGTSDKVWNSWKGALLRELYHATREVFRRGLHNPLLQSEYIHDVQDRTRALLTDRASDSQAINTLWSHLGDEYFLRYQPEEIVWHTEAILSRENEQQPVVLIRDVAKRGGSEVFIYCRTFDTLFLAATALLESRGISIMDARIFDSLDAYTLDSFLVVDEHGEMLGNTADSAELAESLQARLISAPQSTIRAVSRHLPRQAKHFTFETRVNFDQEANYQRTLMHVTAFDRPGLLSRIAQVLDNHRIRLRNARIATFGERAEDYFYITDSEDRMIEDTNQLEQLANSIKQSLQG